MDFDNMELEKSKKKLNNVFNLLRLLVDIVNRRQESNNLKKQEKLLWATTSNYRKTNKKTGLFDFNVYEKYSRPTSKNLEKLKKEYEKKYPEYRFSYTVEEILEQLTAEYEKKYYTKIYYDNLEGVIDELNYSRNVVDLIDRLSKIYERLMKSIIFEENSQIRIEKNQKAKEIERINEEAKKRQSDREFEQFLIENSTLNKDVTRLNKGPKRRTLYEVIRKIDPNVDDIKSLYRLAMDILIIMARDQYVELYNYDMNDIYTVPMPYFSEEKKQELFKKHNVTSIEQLLNKYEKIRQTYYRRCSKLSKERRKKYEFSNFSHDYLESLVSSLGGFEHLRSAFSEQSFTFPPTKDRLISFINGRILRCKLFRHHPQARIDSYGNITNWPRYTQEYDNAKKYYVNLTKNMDFSQSISLYRSVCYQIDMWTFSERDGIKDILKFKNSFKAMIQKIFCEILMDKKALKVNGKNYDAITMKIVKEDFEEEPYYYTNDREVSVVEKHDGETIYAEYIKYRAAMTQRNEKKILKFRDFVKTKYEIKDLSELSELEKIYKEKRKGK